MSDEHAMPAAERAAYANGWHARDVQIEARDAVIVTLKDEVARLRQELGKRSPLGLRDGE
jgi:hypothetical protein